MINNAITSIAIATHGKYSHGNYRKQLRKGNLKTKRQNRTEREDR
jgi:hypothetical protein